MALNNLKILFWNSQSILGKIDETFDYLLTNNIDIALFTETWLKPDKSFSHPNYISHRNDRIGQRGGGVAIVVRKGLHFSVMPELSDLKIIESLGIKIETTKGPICLAAVYYPGGPPTDLKLSQFDDDISKLNNQTIPYFICGDLNAKHIHWNCRKRNKAGSTLYNSMISSNFIIKHPNNHTYFSQVPNAIPSTLDIVLTNNLVDSSNPIALHQLSSDHLPVEFEIITHGQTLSTNKAIKRYDLANWVKYKNVINNSIDLSVSALVKNIKSTSDIDVLIKKFTDIMKYAEEVSVPIVSSTSIYSDLGPIILPDNVRALIVLRNTRRRQWQRSRLHYLKEIVNFLQKLIKKKIQILRNDRCSDYLESIQTSDDINKIWKTSKILRSKNRGIPTLVQNTNVNGQLQRKLLISSKDKADLIALEFSKVHESAANIPPSDTFNEVNRSIFNLNESCTVMEKPNLTSPSEIKSIISNLKNKKAPGSDNLNNKLIKRLPKKALISLMLVFFFHIFQTFGRTPT